MESSAKLKENVFNQDNLHIYLIFIKCIFLWKGNKFLIYAMTLANMYQVVVILAKLIRIVMILSTVIHAMQIKGLILRSWKTSFAED